MVKVHKFFQAKLAFKKAVCFFFIENAVNSFLKNCLSVFNKKAVCDFLKAKNVIK